MPYLHCPECRLTINTTTLADASDTRCPRCMTEMVAAPASLFRSPPTGRPRPEAPADGTVRAA